MEHANRLPRGIRKYIRREKARLRREVGDVAKQEIEKLYERFKK